MKMPNARAVSRFLVIVALVGGLWQLSGLAWSVFSEALGQYQPAAPFFREFMDFVSKFLGYVFQILAACGLSVEIMRHIDADYDEERARDCLDACEGHDTRRVRAALLACEGMSTERLRSRPRPIFEGDLYAVPEGFKAVAYGSESMCVKPPGWHSMTNANGCQGSYYAAQPQATTRADPVDIALGLDIHAWLVHRASLVLGARMTIGWALLYSQFGEGFASDEKGQHHFKVAFLRHLATLTEGMPELYYEEIQSGLVFGPIPSKRGEPA